MRIDLRNRNREFLFTVEVDLKSPPAAVKPPREATAPSTAATTQEVYLNWHQAIDDQGCLRQCPACGCRELFVRKDFPQITGFSVVVLGAVATMVLFYLEHVLWAFGLLALMVLADALIYLFTGRCLVCYRCRSEYRGMPIRKNHPQWELAIGEKYRPAPAAPGTEAVRQGSGAVDDATCGDGRP